MSSLDSPPRHVAADRRCVRRGRHVGRYRDAAFVLAQWLLVFTTAVSAQSPATSNNIQSLKQLSFDDLVNVEVTSVSGRAEELSKVASAIQVISQEDIRRSGATRLPEVLRLASNLDVAQLDSSQWAISARGFNGPLANKLLVLIDGRTVYSPLFAGVFWDTQDLLLEDIDRIEVISGPGATLWGANAVNGVINITTKNAVDTPGLFLEGGSGAEVPGFGSARYGAALTPTASLRVYGKYTTRDSAALSTGEDAANDWRMGQGGFRLDWQPSIASRFTLQGDVYQNRLSATGPDDSVTTGANVTGRWSRALTADSDVKVQLYFDRIHRDIPGGYDDVLDTFDVDFQHRRRSASKRHDISWGASYRGFNDDFGPGALALIPRQAFKQTFGAFVQDEMPLVAEHLNLTVGTKIEHGGYTGFEFQPSIRLAWIPSEHHTLWTAVSRAVRTPSRIDRDLIVPPVAAGGPDFGSEELLAYELGYRVRPQERLSLAVASYYNDYHDIRSVELGNPPAPLPLIFANGQHGESYGAELTADYRPTDWWRIRSGYTELRIHIRPSPGSGDRTFGQAETATPNRQLSFRSSFDLSKRLEMDPAFRYVSRITNPGLPVPGYGELDLHLGWNPTPRLTLSIVGQNLLHDRHPEFGDPATRQEIQRSVYARVTHRW